MARKTSRKSHRRNTRKRGGRSTGRRRMCGRGWTNGPDFVQGAPGAMLRNAYAGPGKDCPVIAERHGTISNHTSKGILSGGRYGIDLSAGILNPQTGVGSTPGPSMRIPCERGYQNPLNPTPESMVGGVSVGAADSMRYYAPTAGYSNSPMAPSVSTNPGILMQVPYPARAFNKACLTTGGRRRNSRRRGCSRRRRH